MERKAVTDKKRAIFDSTLALIREHGFHGTPMSQIARSAGVAAGTIYLYFEGKCDLIKQLYLYVQEQMLDAVLQGDNPEEEPKTRLMRFWENHYRYYTANPASLYFMEQYINSPYATGLVLHEHERFQRVIGDLFRSGVASGLLKPFDIQLFGIILHGSIINAAKTSLSGRMTIRETELNQIFGALWDAIRKQP